MRNRNRRSLQLRRAALPISHSRKLEEKGIEAVDPAQKLLLERAEKEHQLALKHTENELKLRLEYFQKEKNGERGQIETLNKLIDVCMSPGRYSDALAYCDKAIEISDKVNLRGSGTTAELTFKSAQLYLGLEKLDDATKAFGRAAIMYDQPFAVKDSKKR